MGRGARDIMPRRRLPRYVQGFIRNGIAFHYLRRRGCPRVRLRGAPWSDAFMRAYAAALAGEPVSVDTPIATRFNPNSMHSAIAGYLGSGDFARLAPRTRADRRHL